MNASRASSVPVLQHTTAAANPIVITSKLEAVGSLGLGKKKELYVLSSNLSIVQAYYSAYPNATILVKEARKRVRLGQAFGHSCHTTTDTKRFLLNEINASGSRRKHIKPTSATRIVAEAVDTDLDPSAAVLVKERASRVA